MELNRKILKLGLIGITIILIISLGFAFSIKLHNPVFLKYFIEERVNISNEYYQPAEFQMKYISNVQDNRNIAYIEFMDNEDSTHKLLGNNIYSTVDNYGLFNMNISQIKIDEEGMPMNLDRLEINNARVHFNNGDTMDVDLGRIILHSRGIGGDYFEFGHGGSSSDGTSSSFDSVKEDIRLIELESPIFQEAKGLYDIKIDGIDYRKIQGIEYKEGDGLRVNSLFKAPENILDRYTEFELQPRLYFQDSKDDISYINIFNIRHRPYDFDFWGILKYLKARGEI